MDDRGVTSAFLFTNFAILLNANAMVWRFRSRFLHKCWTLQSWTPTEGTVRASHNFCLSFSLFSHTCRDQSCRYTKNCNKHDQGSGIRSKNLSLCQFFLLIPNKGSSESGLEVNLPFSIYMLRRISNKSSYTAKWNQEHQMLWSSEIIQFDKIYLREKF